MKYIEWPDNPAEHKVLILCFSDADRIGKYLFNYEGRDINGRELVLRRIAATDSIEGCQGLYLPASEEQRLSTILRSKARQPLLTISDAEMFAQQGGAIALVRTGGRYQFDINFETLTQSGLKAGAPMLRLARNVIGLPR